ncbi:hypothetical protein GCM10010924_38540 [Rhizobium wenxiniae]|nr:hypothetical protein GCM10010924_38540 [Rhizobium wenxiniae]
MAAREMMVSKVGSGEKIDGKAFEITDEYGANLKPSLVRLLNSIEVARMVGASSIPDDI